MLKDAISIKIKAGRKILLRSGSCGFKKRTRANPSSIGIEGHQPDQARRSSQNK